MSGNIEYIRHLLSASAYLIYAIKAHLQPSQVYESPSRRDHHARYLFWIAYICDKGFSLATGLSPVLSDSNCDLDFENGAQPVSPLLTVPQYSDVPSPGSVVFIYLHLAFIQSQIYERLYSPEALHQDEANTLRNIRSLDVMLEQWRVTMPMDHRPSFTTFLGNDNTVRSIKASIFYLQYHHCLILIHQTSTRCSSWETNKDPQHGTSSLAITVTASRNLLGSFIDSRFELDSRNIVLVFPSCWSSYQVIGSRIFWNVRTNRTAHRFCLSYFMQAIFNICCKILSCTSDHTNSDDALLIGKIAKVIQSQRQTTIFTSAASKMEVILEFIFELGRLAEASTQ